MMDPVGEYVVRGKTEVAPLAKLMKKVLAISRGGRVGRLCNRSAMCLWFRPSRFHCCSKGSLRWLLLALPRPVVPWRCGDYKKKLEELKHEVVNIGQANL